MLHSQDAPAQKSLSQLSDHCQDVQALGQIEQMHPCITLMHPRLSTTCSQCISEQLRACCTALRAVAQTDMGTRFGPYLHLLGPILLQVFHQLCKEVLILQVACAAHRGRVNGAVLEAHSGVIVGGPPVHLIAVWALEFASTIRQAWGDTLQGCPGHVAPAAARCIRYQCDAIFASAFGHSPNGFARARETPC